MHLTTRNFSTAAELFLFSHHHQPQPQAGVTPAAGTLPHHGKRSDLQSRAFIVQEATLLFAFRSVNFASNNKKVRHFFFLFILLPHTLRRGDERKPFLDQSSATGTFYFFSLPASRTLFS